MLKAIKGDRIDASFECQNANFERASLRKEVGTGARLKLPVQHESVAIIGCCVSRFDDPVAGSPIQNRSR